MLRRATSNFSKINRKNFVTRIDNTDDIKITILNQNQQIRPKVFQTLREKIGYVGNDELLLQALTHSSFDKIRNSGRFSFIGRMAMKMFICENIMKKYPTASETKLTAIESMYTNRMTLYLLARDSWNLEELIKTGNEYNRYSNERKRKTLANFVNSIIGTVYNQYGVEETKNFVSRNILEPQSPQEIYTKLLSQDPLETLNEIKVSHGKLPSLLTEKLGNGKFKVSICMVTNGVQVLGQSEGNSEEEAARLAALTALINMGSLIPDY